jgi:hypothetical protein
MSLVDLAERNRREVDGDPVVGFYQTDVVLLEVVRGAEQTVFEPERGA